MSEIALNNSDPSTSNSPGAILKRCREYHDITLEEAAEATKIGINYLTALENDQITVFSSPAYLKGFLRIYATHLGLNPDDMMRLYEKLYAPAEHSNDKADPPGNSTSRRRRGFSWQRLALPTCLLLLIIITSAIINRKPAPPQQQPAPLPVASSAPATPAVQPVLSSAQLPPAEPKNENVSTPADSPVTDEPRPEKVVARKPAEQVNAFIVRMKVTGNGTLAMTIDGATTQNYELAAGDIIEWKAERSMALELSNAGGVEAELNGTPLKPFGQVGAPAYVVLDAEGVKP